MRLIDAYALSIDRDDFETYADYVKAFDAINEAPTVEAEPVIRCKDCKFSSPNGVYGCRIHSFADDLDKRLYADDWCSRAERKED